jgi:hypothetical protein
MSAYTILCRPSDGQHVAYTTGRFATYEEAKSRIPGSGTSFDCDDGVMWYYSVEKIEMEEGGKMEEVSRGFPY